MLYFICSKEGYCCDKKRKFLFSYVRADSEAVLSTSNLGRSQLLVRRRSFIPNEVNSKWKIAHFGKVAVNS